MKDWLTLKRNKGFIVSFIVVPLAFCSLFCWLQSLALDGTKEGSLIEGNLHFSSNEKASEFKTLVPSFPDWLTVLYNYESLTFDKSATVATHCGAVLDPRG